MNNRVLSSYAIFVLLLSLPPRDKAANESLLCSRCDHNSHGVLLTLRPFRIPVIATSHGVRLRGTTKNFGLCKYIVHNLISNIEMMGSY